MLRGEFIRADGLVTPNNITKFGAAQMLSGALRNEFTSLWLGLVDGVPDANLRVEDLTEPTLGANGYSRQEITRDAVGWPIQGELNNEPYYETQWHVWNPTGAGFDVPIRRLMLTASESGASGDVFALSAALPALVTLTPQTPLEQRRFKYRIYLR